MESYVSDEKQVLLELLQQRQYDEALDACEKLELLNGPESQQEGFFAVYLTLLLIKIDLDNARYLWKRAPPSIKHKSSEFSALWEIGKKLWNRDIKGAYQAMLHDWSDTVKPLVDELKAAVVTSSLSLIRKVYSKISVQIMSELLNTTPEEILLECQRLGWNIDISTNISYVIIESSTAKEIKEKINIIDDTKLLKQLSDYVYHLEKRTLRVDLSGKSTDAKETVSGTAISSSNSTK
mmetsp:Transcript_26571/g.26817  ORF Transcript_26571/g.26817 Transcript_26571/m.26817 type:complete len:237 (-) Transcript_26571:20-730(-)